jgi:hypothetical protein
LLQEIATLKAHIGPLDTLGEAEAILLQLESIPMFRPKLQLLHNMASFDAASLQQAAKSYIHACSQLCLSPSLLKLLAVLLTHANFMNAEKLKVRFPHSFA